MTTTRDRRISGGGVRTKPQATTPHTRDLSYKSVTRSGDKKQHIVKYLGEAQRRHQAEAALAIWQGWEAPTLTERRARRIRRGRTRHIQLPKYYRTQQHGNLARLRQVWFTRCRSEGISLANGP
jgi:hypothetical protein